MQVTWKGDADQSIRVIKQYGLTFPIGEAVDVPDDHPQAAKFKASPAFDVSGGEQADEAHKAVHKGRGVWAVRAPDGNETGPFTKDEAAEYAAAANADKPVE